LGIFSAFYSTPETDIPKKKEYEVLLN